MSKTIATPHDALFRQFLGHTETARDFLRIHLPPALLAVCDLDTLQLESGSFVEEDLRPHYSDILYSLETRSGTGYIYSIIEHQSTPDPLMAWRLLKYSIAAMQRHLDKGHKQLPLVIPVLFYHGATRPYPYSTAWLDGFADPAMAGELYTRSFPLVDVTAIPDDEILTHKRVALLEMVQKHIQVRDLAEIIDSLALLLTRERITDVQLASVLHYIIQAGETRQPRADRRPGGPGTETRGHHYDHRRESERRRP